MTVSAAPNLILGVVDGMSWAETAPFVNSLRMTEFAGDVVLLVDDVEPEVLARLASAGVVTIRRRRLQLRLGDRRIRPYDPRLARLHAAYPPMIRAAASLGRNSLLARARIGAALSVRDIRRFLVYFDYLTTQPGRYGHVVLTDVRDVVFNEDPFSGAAKNVLQCFLEDSRKRLGTEPHNRMWLEAAFGEAVARELAAFPIACAGVTIGPEALVRGYLAVMARFLTRLPRQGTGLDQAVHNYVLRNGLVADAVLVSNGEGAVATLGIVPEGEIDSLLAAPVLHQYDRHPTLKERIMARFGDGRAGVSAD